MSYRTWHTYGYGICLSNIKDCTLGRIRKLLELVPKYQKFINIWIERGTIKNTSDDYLEFNQDFVSALATVLKQMIFEEERIEFTTCIDYGGNVYLLYEPLYPWNISKNELSLTEDSIIAVLRKYVSILTDKTIDVNYQSVENGG